MLLGAWRERAERGDAHEEAQLALLLREAPAHTPASFERALLDYLQMLGYTQLSGGGGGDADGGGGGGGGGGTRAAAAGGATPSGKRRKGEASADGATRNGVGGEPSSKKARREAKRAEAARAELAAAPAPAGASPRGISAHFVAQVCARCLREKSAEWLQPLRLLMSCGAVTAAVHPQLLPALCEARQG